MNAAQFFGAMFGPLRRLADFSGRSTRAEFWPFVFLIYAVQQIGTMIAINPFMQSFQKFADADREGAVTPAMQAEMTRQFFSLFDHIMTISGVFMVASVVLLSAVVTRRLHDAGRSGWWAAPIVALGASGVWLFSRVFPLFRELQANDPGPEAFREIMTAMIPVFANNALYLVVFITVIVFCAQDGTAGPNRFGEDPKGRDPAEEAERRAALAEQRLKRETALREPAKRPPPARITTDTPNER